jgi:hypothetical protein
MGNGKWEMGNGKWEMGHAGSHFPSPISHLPTPISHFPFPISHFHSQTGGGVIVAAGVGPGSGRPLPVSREIARTVMSWSQMI